MVWEAEVTVWPYQTNAGAKADQEACGPEMQKFTISKAEKIEHALYCAQLIVTGIKTNPRVWMATVRSIREKKETE